MHVESNFLPDPKIMEKVGAAPLIAHIIYRLDVGGLENGLVNLINRIPEHRYRHAIICLTDYSNFRHRIKRSDVSIFALNKPPGHSLATHIKLWRLLRQLRPAIVHTRNLAALESALTATLARVPIRVHGEHGRDVEDLDGKNRKYRVWRRCFRPFVHHYIALSKDLERYLRDNIGVSSDRVSQLYNGVDTGLFFPASPNRVPLPYPDFTPANAFIIGTVGRMQTVKDQVTLARAFVLLLSMIPKNGRPLKLVMIGDGPLREQVANILKNANASHVSWLPGERDDVAYIMRSLDLFVLPSLAEGISNTILEAMASGLPVIATDVGGNPELVTKGKTGELVERANPETMAKVMFTYYSRADDCHNHGLEARRISENKFSIDTMVNNYISIYDRLVKQQITKRSQ